MNLKSKKVQKYWGKKPAKIDYSNMDQSIIREFKGTHPEIVKNWLPKSSEIYQTNPLYKLTLKQRKHRIMIKFENIFNKDLSNKHYKLI